MENVYCVCTSSAVTFIDIFVQQEQAEEQLSLAKIVNECVNCEVRPDVALPKQICLSCVLDAKNALHFKRRCEQSHQHFCEMLRSNRWLCKQEVNDTEDELKVEEFVVKELQASKQVNSRENNLKLTAETVTTTNTHKCEICNEAFSNRTNLMLHALVHNNENPDKCPHCGKEFISRGSLTRHIRAHSGERPYKSIFCGKRFTQSCNLDKQSSS